METLILSSNSKKDLELIREIAEKCGISAYYSNTEETLAQRNENLLAMARRLDQSVIPNEITMDEILEEVRLVREERKKYGKKNNS